MTNLTESSLVSNYSTTGFSERLGFGRSPALLMIDLVVAYYQEGSPLYHPDFATGLASSLRLLETARHAEIPVILTNVEYTKGGSDGGVFFKKARAALSCFENGNPLGRFAEGLTVQPGDVVITKKYASAFCGTPLAAMLAAQGIDTLIMAGVSTSGCVRATAVDACSHGFRPMVVRQAVADRHPAPHEANLFDINAKYGDVIDEAEVARELVRLGCPIRYSDVRA